MPGVLYKLRAADVERSVQADREWRKRARGTQFCAACGKLDRQRFPEPIDVVLAGIPRMVSADEVSILGVGLIHTALLELLQPFAAGFAFGAVYNGRGRLMPQYKTWYSATYIFPRAGPESRVFPCESCGIPGYYHRGGGGVTVSYVLRSQLSDQHLYQDEICCTYVDEWLAAKIDWTPFRDIVLIKIPIRDRPIDGFRLPGDPDWDALPPETDSPAT